jgi:hypothetical protein
VAVMEKCCGVVRLSGTGILFLVGLLGVRGCRVRGASIAVDRKSMGLTVGERWWKVVDFLVFSVAVKERFCSVVRLAVTGNTISGRVVGRQRVPVFEGHLLPSTGSRWDIRRLARELRHEIAGRYLLMYGEAARIGLRMQQNKDLICTDFDLILSCLAENQIEPASLIDILTVGAT